MDKRRLEDICFIAWLKKEKVESGSIDYQGLIDKFEDLSDDITITDNTQYFIFGKTSKATYERLFDMEIPSELKDDIKLIQIDKSVYKPA